MPLDSDCIFDEKRSSLSRVQRSRPAALTHAARLTLMAIAVLTMLAACQDAVENRPIGATFPANHNSARQGYVR